MAYRGHVLNGVVVLDEPVSLANGAPVVVELLEDGTGTQSGGVRRQWKGIFRDTGPVPTDEDIAKMRREAWPHS